MFCLDNMQQSLIFENSILIGMSSFFVIRNLLELIDVKTDVHITAGSLERLDNAAF
jgi:hypothetical protein